MGYAVSHGWRDICYGDTIWLDSSTSADENFKTRFVSKKENTTNISGVKWSELLGEDLIYYKIYDKW